jgi:hypothetical protein
LRERDLLADTDVKDVTRLSQISHETSAGERSAREGYFETGGAMLGSAIGGAVGAAVDECLD